MSEVCNLEGKLRHQSLLGAEAQPRPRLRCREAGEVGKTVEGKGVD